MTVGKRLLEERARLGLSQEAFGKAGGVRKGAQINYEKDARDPDVKYLQGIAAIGADVLYLVTGEHRVDAMEGGRAAAVLSKAVEDVVRKNVFDPSTGTGAFLVKVQEQFQASYAKATEQGVSPGKALSDAELKLLSNYNLASKEGRRSIERIAALEAARREGRPDQLTTATGVKHSKIAIKGDSNVIGNNNKTKK